MPRKNESKFVIPLFTFLQFNFCCYCQCCNFGPDRMAEWLRRETTEPEVLGSNPLQSVTVQTYCLVWSVTLVALYKCEGLFVVL